MPDFTAYRIVVFDGKIAHPLYDKRMKVSLQKERQEFPKGAMLGTRRDSYWYIDNPWETRQLLLTYKVDAKDKEGKPDGGGEVEVKAATLTGVEELFAENDGVAESLLDLPRKILMERLNFDQLLRLSDPRRLARASTVRGPALEIDATESQNNWYFNFKSFPSTTGLRHRGVIEFLKPRGWNPRQRIPLENVNCVVDCSCFAPDTQVLMGDGSYKSICEIRFGDHVYTHTGQVQLVSGNVERELKKEEKVYCLRVEDAEDAIVVTENHPFYVQTSAGFEFVQVKELKEGAVLFSLTDGHKTLLFKEEVSYNGNVWDLCVEEDHSFIVHGVAVANCPDYRFRFAWSNKQRGASRVGPDSLNQALNRAPRVTNPTNRISLCKHLLALRNYVYGQFANFPGEGVDAPRMKKVLAYSRRRWVDFAGEVATARAREKMMAAAREKDRRDPKRTGERRPVQIPGRPQALEIADEPGEIEPGSFLSNLRRHELTQPEEPVQPEVSAPPGEEVPVNPPVSPEESPRQESSYSEIHQPNMSPNSSALINELIEAEEAFPTPEEDAMSGGPGPGGMDTGDVPPPMEIGADEEAEAESALDLLRQIRDLLTDLAGAGVEDDVEVDDDIDLEEIADEAADDALAGEGDEEETDDELEANAAVNK